MNRPTDSPIRLRERDIAASAESLHRFTGFSLVELLVVISIIALLIGIMTPALSKVRDSAKTVVCGSSLHQLGVAIGSYVADSSQRLPYIDSALFAPGGSRNWIADPSDQELYPYELPAVMGTYMVCNGLTRCPSAVLGYPEADYQISYRMSSADNVDGQPRTVEELLHPGGGGVVYNWDLKYLNGRHYDMRIKRTDLESMVAEGIDLSLGWPLTRGVGEFYLFRDFINRRAGRWITPHSVSFNQLFLDLHVELIKELDDIGLTDDRPGD